MLLCFTCKIKLEWKGKIPVRVYFAINHKGQTTAAFACKIKLEWKGKIPVRVHNPG